MRRFKLIQIFLFVFALTASGSNSIQADTNLICLKPTDIGIDSILSVRPVRGPLKDLLGRCNLLNNVETVRYFSEEAFSKGALIGLSSGCLKWVYYLNLAELLQLIKAQSCPR